MKQWNEQDHPRDSYGKFTDGNRSDSVPEDVYQTGLEYDGTFEETISKIKNGSLISDEEMDNAISVISRKFKIPNDRKSGVEDKCLKYILKLKSFDQPPTKLSPSNSKRMLEVITKSHILYRGVSERKYVEQFYQGDMWVGQGLFGNGVYMSLDEKEAYGYILSRCGVETADNMITAFLPTSASIATKDVKSEFLQFKKQWESRNNHRFLNDDPVEVEKYENERNFISDFGKYCALKGYDAYWSKDDKDIVILNRSKMYYV